MGNETFLIGCIYSPPPGSDKIKNSAVKSEIFKSIYYAKKVNDENKFKGLIIAGDFYFPYFKWDKDGVAYVKGSKTSPGANFMHFLEDQFISQNVIEQTFRQANGLSKKFLDYFLSQTPDRVINLSIEPPLGSSVQAHLSITYFL